MPYNYHLIFICGSEFYRQFHQHRYSRFKGGEVLSYGGTLGLQLCDRFFGRDPPGYSGSPNAGSNFPDRSRRRYFNYDHGTMIIPLTTILPLLTTAIPQTLILQHQHQSPPRFNRLTHHEESPPHPNRSTHHE